MHGRIGSTRVYGSIEFVLISAGGEAVNAQVCKTCIRGFNSRPALQILQQFFLFLKAKSILIFASR